MRTLRRRTVHDIAELLSELQKRLLRCGLVLAGADARLQTGALAENAQDGLLTGEEILAIDLRGTKLVVLATCETGVGEASVQDFSFDQPRAFGIAEVDATICARRLMSDDATAMLMRNFYEALVCGQS